ncbi:hypothetical protein HELRODRAFT_72949 [Helobdella robusta]|uniref:MIP18 family-like domain-containing protein n=1 Tax=Helobdella robusta TaxID=6412 RepID=T1G177_HELRO|nr:hypothetical protein HELRODRAFT_72949 [Helobdella robusta]ESO09901.1 hypothetical protein HELRODRAFT_72949 [Helobdella robusta]
MASVKLENANPSIFKKAQERKLSFNDLDDNVNESFDAREIFDISFLNINDPEHPLTLEELNVVAEDLIEVNDESNIVNVFYKPTIPHCSMATLIGLCIKVKLIRCLPSRFKVISVAIMPSFHVSEAAINKQLADKERIAAALENVNLLKVVNQCLSI